MGSLASCVKKLGISKSDLDEIKKSSEEFKADGHSGPESIHKAVISHTKNLIEERDNIISQIREQVKPTAKESSVVAPKSSEPSLSSEKQTKNEEKPAEKVKQNELQSKKDENQSPTNRRLEEENARLENELLVDTFNKKNKINLSYEGTQEDGKGGIIYHQVTDRTKGSKLEGATFGVKDMTPEGIKKAYDAKLKEFSEEKLSRGKQEKNTIESIHQEATTGEHAKEIKELLGQGKIQIVDTIPEGAKEGKVAGGAYDAKTDTIYLAADGVKAGNVNRVIEHEAFHRAMEQGKFKGVLTELSVMEKAGSEQEWFKKAEQVAGVDKGSDNYHEEIGAYAVQHYEAAPNRIKAWVNRLLARAKVALREWGLNVGKIDDAMLREIAIKGLKGEGGGSSDIKFMAKQYGITEKEAARQYSDVEKQYKGTAEWMKAPNGEETKLNERQWVQTRTPVFKEWFGKSTVIDKNGDPLVVYHGTDTGDDFSTFKVNGLGQHGHGAYFSNETRTADIFSGVYSPSPYNENPKPRVFSAFLKIENPITSDEYFRSRVVKKEADSGSLLAKFKTIIWHKIRQYDGVVNSHAKNYDFNEFVVRDPNQIKSAIGNTGQFSSKSNDIRFSRTKDGHDVELKKDIEKRANEVGPIRNVIDLKKVQRILTPGLDIVKGVKEGIQSLLLPSSKSPLHLAAAETLRNHIGIKNNNGERASAELRPHVEAFDRMGVTNEKTPLAENAGPKFMSDMSTGKEMTKTLQDIADKVKSLFKDRLKQLEALGVSLQTIRENYFPGMWKKESIRAFNQALHESIEQGRSGEDISKYTKEQKEWVKNRADELFDAGEGTDKDGLQYIAKRPFEGSESFRKAKVFDDIMTGIEFGLRPISNNPIELVKLKLSEMDTNIAANGAMQDYNRQGKEKFIPVHEKIPSDWVKVNDKYGTVYGPPTVGMKEYVDKNVYDGLTSVAKGLGITPERLMNAGRGRLGYASPLGETVSQFGTELSVLAHEIGHQLDFKYGLWDKIVTGATGIGKRGEVTKSASAEQRGKIQSELRTLADLTWEGSEPSNSYKQKVRKQAEKMAHMLEAYIHAPDKFKEVAPTVYESFDSFIKSRPETSKLAEIKQGLALKELTNEKYVGLPIIGYRIVTKEVGDILNNYLSSPLYNNPYFGSAYKLYMGAANALNQVQLVGFFHAGFTSGEVQIMAGANIAKDVFGVLRGTQTAGNLMETIKKFPTAIYNTPKLGGEVLEEWRNPGASMNPKIQQIAEAAKLAGAGFKMEQGLRTDQLSKMRQDWYSDHKIRAALRSPVGGLELMAKPILDWLVPKQKAGIFGIKVMRIIDRNPGVPLADLAHEFNQAWNTTDASLGQVRYDRLFINTTAKNMVQGLLRAPGWTGGTLAQIGGAFKDTGTFLKTWQETGTMPKDMPDRVAYTLSLVATTAIANGLMTFAMTGEGPKDEKDLFAFRTGNTDEYGRPERMMWPTYMKDVRGWTSSPGTTAINKLNPLLSMFGALIKNKDYFGKEIRSEDASKLTQLAESLGYISAQVVPFSARNISKEFERKSSTTAKVAPMVGITPAPSDLNKTEAEKLISHYSADKMPQGSRTKAETEKSNIKREIKTALRHGDTAEATKLFKEGRKSGMFGIKDYAQIQKDVKSGPFATSFKYLSLVQAQKVYDVSTDEEKKIVKPLLAKKKINELKKGKIKVED